MDPKPARPTPTNQELLASHRGMRPWRALGLVRRVEFDAPDYHFVSLPFCGDAPVLEGRLHEVQLQRGMWLHCAEVRDLHSMASRAPLEAGLRLVVILAGELDVSIGGHRLQLRAGAANNARAALLAMPQDALFERRWKRGKWERKLSLHFTPSWLAEHAELFEADGFGLPAPMAAVLHGKGGRQEVHAYGWAPSPHAVSLAEQLILDAVPADTGLTRLRQAGRALELLHEALMQCGREPASSPTKANPAMRPKDFERMLRLRSFLDAEVQELYGSALSIEELGRRFGLSSSAMQRQFRQAFGSSINEYRRNMRLQQARADLENGCTISDAAHRAGYTSAANFSTAFRRRFGVSPRDLIRLG